ncbi:unnamed protein product [Phytophthora fragariaefolia]|uniref:Unnamed protein product n=1 Tax=Phytophthora fragariaefolia TaxID=1490495 RepID=A0A9W6WY02_9STRA|nr:unnamed protein product [Phytophthora fragariaefolia]
MRAERKQVASQHRDTHEVIAQAKEGAVALEKQCQVLKKQQERAKELHDREMIVLHDTIRQLKEEKNEMEVQHAREKQLLAESVESLKALQYADRRQLEEQVRMEIEQRMLQELLPEKLSELIKEHKEVVSVMESEHKHQLAQLAAQLNETEPASTPSTRAIETQTDPQTTEESGTAVGCDNQSQEQIEGLTRRCRALEKLLDKKFEDTSSSRRCESCHSDDVISTSSVLSGQHPLDTSLSNSIHSDSSSHMRASSKSRALARALLGSSRASLDCLSLDNKSSPFVNETTLGTDEATLGAHEMWDSASFTSMDTVDDLSSFTSQRTTPRRRMQSSQEILSLVRHTKQAAASPLDTRRERREPDPEVNWEPPKQRRALPASKGQSLSFGGGPAKGYASNSVRPAAPGVSAFDDLLR